MNKFFLIKASVQSLVKNKIRTFLTILAMSVGITAVIVVTSAGQSLKSFVLGQLDVFGSDLIQIETKIPSAKKNSSANAIGIARGVTITTLKLSDADAIAKLQNTAYVSPGLTGQELISYKDQIKKTLLFGANEDFLKVNKLNLSGGRGITKDDNDSLAKVAILGATVKDKLFGLDDPLGKEIKINRVNYQVVGVLAKQGTAGFMDMDSIVYLPIKTLQKSLLGIDHILYISMTVKDQKLIDDTAAEITDLLRRRHNITDPNKEDFSVTTMAEARQTIDTVFNGLTMLLLALVAVSLVIGGVGIMNIMYVTVSERTYEIGLRKAMGATVGDIFWQFLFEALIMTLVAGGFGVILGIILSFTISVVASASGFNLPFSLSTVGLFVAIVFSGSVGLIFGLTPARRASLLDPVVALRQD